jgi:hypothetical protein
LSSLKSSSRSRTGTFNPWYSRRMIEPRFFNSHFHSRTRCIRFPL